jgi:hypothetical protein
MSFTRFHDDPARIMKQQQESTDQGKWRLNVPGNGDKPCFMMDPSIRLQKWGANLMTNTTNLESSLFGLDRNLSRDCNPKNNYKDVNTPTSALEYPVCSPFTDQSRVTNPAWWYRDLEQPNWDYLHLNPQENTCMSFQNNLSTRILEKDNYVTKPPCFNYNMIDNTQKLFTN